MNQLLLWTDAYLYWLTPAGWADAKSDDEWRYDSHYGNG